MRTSLGSHQNLAELANGRADLALVQNDKRPRGPLPSHSLREALHLIVREEVKSPTAERIRDCHGQSGGRNRGMAMATLAHWHPGSKFLRIPR